MDINNMDTAEQRLQTKFNELQCIFNYESNVASNSLKEIKDSFTIEIAKKNREIDEVIKLKNAALIEITAENNKNIESFKSFCTIEKENLRRKIDITSNKINESIDAINIYIK